MFDHQVIPSSPTGLARTMETNQRLSLTETINVSTTDPSHLFWVPASNHPEIAPTEFEKHVQALRVNVMNDDKTRRRKSALSVSFTAVDGDILQGSDISQAISSQPGQPGDKYQTDSHFSDDDKTSTNDIDQQDDDELQNISDNTHRQLQQQQAFSSLVRSNSLHSLTGNDDDDELQAKETSSTTSSGKPIDNDNTKDQHIKLGGKARKGRVRRSMSLQLPDSTTDPGSIPDFLVFDRNSAILDQSPVLISKTNRPLSRRGARTKFRKTSTTTISPLKSMDVPPLPKQWSAEDCHVDSSSSTIIDNNTLDKFDNRSTKDTDTMVENQQYQHLNLHHNEEPEMDVGVTSTFATVTPIQHSTTTNDLNFNVSTIILDSLADQPPPPLLHPTSTLSATIDAKPRPLSELPVVLQQSTGNSPPRERKSSWSWSFWANDKKAKQDKTADPTTFEQPGEESNDIETKGSENTAPPPPTPPPLPSPPISEPSSSSTSTSKQRFGLSSLFSRKPSTQTTPNMNAKSEKEKQQQISSAAKMPPKDFQLNKMNHQRRLPIHTERAMYRLSHMKLANSKRPLRDQVIISNFMFWYLSVINNQQQQQQQQSQPLVTFPEHDDANSSTNSTPPRQNMPRTPQQIIAASRKKKRPTKKNHSHATQQKPTMAAPASSSYQKKRSSSLTSSPQLRENTGHHYIDRSSKNQTSSTGFVVPENYLRPAAAAAPMDRPANGSHHSSSNPKQQRQHPGYARSNSWSSDDDDEEDEDESDDDSDDDDGYIGKGNHGSTFVHNNSRNERNPGKQLHTTQTNISPSNQQQQQQHNRHPYNQRQQQQQQRPEQHPQHYLISASAT